MPIPEDYYAEMTMEKFVEFMMDNHEQSAMINWEIPIRICKSAAGYYIGQLDADWSPMTRLSNEYWSTEEAATEALDNFWFSARTHL
jgi:hypothetical protein